MGWTLKRLHQCAKCPWKVSTDPRDIPNGYSVERHAALAATIAAPGSLEGGETLRVMACHAHDSEEGVHCVGWLHHQLGVGNNIPLRLHMRDCDNVHLIAVDGDQHQRFEDTLPDPEDLP